MEIGYRLFLKETVFGLPTPAVLVVSAGSPWRPPLILIKRDTIPATLAFGLDIVGLERGVVVIVG